MNRAALAKYDAIIMCKKNTSLSGHSMLRLIDRLKAFFSTHKQSGKIFVIGSGRSGTHWLGYVLAGHPNIEVTVEKPLIFRMVTKAATHRYLSRSLDLQLVRLLYRWEHARVAPKYYGDKSHPNIWHVEMLISAFPDAKFLGIQRNPYATVNSMLQHPDVRHRCEDWKNYPVPNPFLGITRQNQDEYANLSIEGKCAVRWLSHRDRLKQLEQTYPNRVCVVQYEELMKDAQSQLTRIEKFLGLTTPIPMPKIRHESLDKWQSELTDVQISKIAHVTGVAPHNC